MTVTRIRNTTRRLTGCALAFGASVALAGYIGFSKSMRVMTAPAPAAPVSSAIPLPPPVHDPHRPTVAILLGNTFSEPTDVLGPYAMFAESGEYTIRVVLAPVFIGCAPLAFLLWLKRAVKTGRRIGLELKVPPVAVAVITAALMWCARWATPDFDSPLLPNPMVPVGLAIVGALTCLAGVVAFRQAKTTVNPIRPDTTSSLVVTGIYRYTRNPMYLGFLVLLLGWAAALSNAWATVSVLAFVLYVNRFQIVPEERMLASRFARDYAEYRARVRRWL